MPHCTSSYQSHKLIYNCSRIVPSDWRGGGGGRGRAAAGEDSGGGWTGMARASPVGALHHRAQRAAPHRPRPAQPSTLPQVWPGLPPSLRQEDLPRLGPAEEGLNSGGHKTFEYSEEKLWCNICRCSAERKCSKNI